MKRITLYHYSDADISGAISPKFYGAGAYTRNDTRATSIKRAFYYVQRAPEAIFASARYIYTVTVSARRIYDLRADSLGLVQGADNITVLLQSIKKKFDGVIYNTGGIDIVNLFYTTKIASKNLKKFGGD